LISSKAAPWKELTLVDGGVGVCRRDQIGLSLGLVKVAGAEA